MIPFRVIDTGVRPCREQMAFDQALIEGHRAGTTPDTIRFLTFPPSVLVGRHQAISQELNLPACREAGVGIGRRVTGGGALYLDEGQFGWEIIADRRRLGMTSLAEVAKAFCEAAAAGLSLLGIEARYRPRNDIEVDGRKISGTGGFFDGDTIFYQGTVLVQVDGAKMASLLNIPAAKLARHGQSDAAARINTISALLGRTPPADEVKAALLQGFATHLGITPTSGPILASEEDAAARIFDEEIGQDEFVYGIDDPAHQAEVLSGSHASPGGTISAHLRLERGRLREIVFTGDFFVTPPRTIADLEASLRGVEVKQIRSAIESFFASTQTGLLSAGHGDFADAVDVAIRSLQTNH